MDNIYNRIHSAVRKAGYEYAKWWYENWLDQFADDIEDEESLYFKSVDENGHPFEKQYQEHMPDQVSHTYYSGSNDDFFTNFNILGFSKEDRDLVKDEDLFDVLWDGVNDFMEEIYHHAKE